MYARNILAIASTLQQGFHQWVSLDPVDTRHSKENEKNLKPSKIIFDTFTLKSIKWPI